MAFSNLCHILVMSLEAEGCHLIPLLLEGGHMVSEHKYTDVQSSAPPFPGCAAKTSDVPLPKIPPCWDHWKDL